jgi:hypothetical protein
MTCAWDLDTGQRDDPSMTALKIFVFFFVGGLVGLGFQMAGVVSPDLTPLIIILSGFGAVACVSVFVQFWP